MSSILIRCDASLSIGSGHVMRCRTLARELKRRGAVVTFLCRRQSGDLIRLLEQEFAVLPLPELPLIATKGLVGRNFYQAWLGCSQSQDAADCLQVLSAAGISNPDWFVVDHYGLDASWEARLMDSLAGEEISTKLLVIDDLADRSHQADLLLDQNFFGTVTDQRYQRLVPSHCHQLLGPHYALLGPEYAQLHPVMPSRTELRRLLVFFGGVDPDNLTSRTLEALLDPALAHLAVDVVLGRQSPHRQAVAALVAERPSTTLHEPLPSLAGLIARADLAIGAGGATTLERACLRLPSLVVAIAENQVPFAEALHQAGHLQLLGESAKVSAEQIRSKLLAWVADPRQLDAAGDDLTDGMGAMRLALEMLGPQTTITNHNLKYDIARANPFVIQHEIKERKKDASFHERSTLKVLLSSSSSKVSLVRALQKAAREIDPRSSVIAGDIDPSVLSFYVADAFWEMPRLSDVDVALVLAKCQELEINVVLPTRDGELLFWSQNALTFRQFGIEVVVSEPEPLKRCFDKLAFSDFGKANGLPFIPSSLSIDDLKSERFVVKERFGSGSQSVKINLAYNEARASAESLKEPIFQPYVEGKEISIDGWIDKNSHVKGLVLRSRDLVENGEAQVTTTFRDESIESLCTDILAKLSLRGPVVMQAIIDSSNNVQIIECNARFGGASTASIMVGLNSLRWSLLEAVGAEHEDYPFIRALSDVKQVRTQFDTYE